MSIAHIYNQRYESLRLILVIWNRSEFNTFEINSFSKFDQYRGWAHMNAHILRLLSVVVAFIVIETLLLLNTQFPTFGILFYTIGKSKKELLIFGIVNSLSYLYLNYLVYCDFDDWLYYIRDNKLWTVRLRYGHCYQILFIFV